VTKLLAPEKSALQMVMVARVLRPGPDRLGNRAERRVRDHRRLPVTHPASCSPLIDLIDLTARPTSLNVTFRG
jgi:hypothetical protein